jgi:superfamily I DNA and/or RNA helicase
MNPRRILGSLPPSSNLASSLVSEMTRMLRFFRMLHDSAGKVSLGEESASTPAAEACLRGLSGMLTTQWRMHPVIGSFVSKCFYGSRVNNGDAVGMKRWLRHGFISPPGVKDNAIVWLDTPIAAETAASAEQGDPGGGFVNKLESRIVLGFLRQLLHAPSGAGTLAIMSPYRAQIASLRRLMQHYVFPQIGALVDCLHTADSFQGKQADIVVVSLVRNNELPGGDGAKAAREGMGFLASKQRTTVVFSRAQRLLVVVGCLKHFQRFPDTAMGELANEVEDQASRPKSGIAVLPGETFLAPEHWSRLQQQRAHQAKPHRSTE